jgi:hypothetical protein
MRRLTAALWLVALSFLPACSPEVYEILGGYYVRDGKVYWSGGIDSSDRQRVVVGADPDTLQSIDNSYTRDKSHVYYRGDVLTDADPALTP